MQRFNAIRQYFQSEYEKEYKFYQKYHQHKWNSWIHFFSIPIEWLGALLCIAAIFPKQYRLHEGICVIIALIHLLLYTPKFTSYVCASLHLAFILLINNPPHESFIFSIRITRLSLLIPLDRHQLSYLLLGIFLQAISWFFQVVIGHFMIEKNSPGFTKKFSFLSMIFSVMLAIDRPTRRFIEKQS